MSYQRLRDGEAPWTPYENRSFGPTQFPNRGRLVRGGLVRDRVVKSWNWPIFLLFFNSLLQICWGVALARFATAVVPINWRISQWGERHTGMTNTFVTLVATLSTLHVRFLLQRMVEVHAQASLATGFRLQEWRWMQGVKEWDIWAPFIGYKRSLWVVFYAGMALHSASIVAVVQPVELIIFRYKGIPIPCGIYPNTSTLDASPHLTAANQTRIDQASFGIGMQIGNYYDAIAGNSTTSCLGRSSVKENFAYGTVGGAVGSLQDLPGVTFDVHCTDDDDSKSLQDLWESVFPGRPTPTLTISNDNTSGSFVDSPATPPLLQAIAPAQEFSLINPVLYGLVAANGSGGVISLSPISNSYELTACTWQALPSLVHVETQEPVGVANALYAVNATTIPESVGRAVLQTVQGMLLGLSVGASLKSPTFYNATDGQTTPSQVGWELPSHYWISIPSTSQMLSILLSDGVKASLTGFTAFNQGPLGCDANFQGADIQWRFGNEHNLGWIAIVLTSAVGIGGVVVTVMLGRVGRMVDIHPLEIRETFFLGANSDIRETGRGDRLGDPSLLFKIQGGRVVTEVKKE